MKTLNEILQQSRLQALRTGEDGGQGLMMLDYKNPNKVHPYCLHLWRLQQPGMPLPPSWMVGAKKGQSPTDARRQGEAELTAMERNREQRGEINTDLQA